MKNYRRKNMYCALCGDVIHGKISRDHFYPRAIYKWLKAIIPEEEYDRLEEAISSKDNIIFTHDKCNKEKEEFRVDIHSLFVPENKYAKLKSVNTKIQFYDMQYRDLKERIMNRQNHTCFACGCDLDSNHGVIRRIDTDKDRTEDNGCLVCHECNLKYDDFVTAA